MGFEVTSHVFKSMASRCEICIPYLSGRNNQDAFLLGESEVRRIEKKYSRYLTDSIISSINFAAGKDWVLCDDETNQLLDYTESMYQISGGLFDITSGVLRRAWNFFEPQLPNPDTLQECLSIVGWRDVVRANNAIFLKKQGMEIDFGGVAKEYAADRCAQVLLAHGVTSGYVNLAGDIRVLGPKPDKSPWFIGIQHPRSDRGDMIASIPVESGGLATSGDYERYFDLGDKRYSHLLNPKTGYPNHSWQSVSVLAPSTLIAGTYSTIAMLMDHAAIDFLRESNLPYFAIDFSGKHFFK